MASREAGTAVGRAPSTRPWLIEAETETVRRLEDDRVSASYVIAFILKRILRLDRLRLRARADPEFLLIVSYPIAGT
jgi:hypothetical protein